jgi:hypothetical protein
MVSSGWLAVWYAWIDETCGRIAPARRGSDRIGGASTGALTINRLVPAIEPGFDAKRVSQRLLELGGVFRGEL